uniref:(northern house mosquito) hypothetical protein n=1 Tax=Culex pipiens TaxID=7175 RepID=A0A8D8D063_CULPI
MCHRVRGPLQPGVESFRAVCVRDRVQLFQQSQHCATAAVSERVPAAGQHDHGWAGIASRGNVRAGCAEELQLHCGAHLGCAEVADGVQVRWDLSGYGCGCHEVAR